MSSINVFKIFPIPVFEYQITDYKQINLELKNYIYKLKNLYPEGIKKSNQGGWHSPNFDIRNSSSAKNFFLKIKNKLPIIFEDYMGWECKLDQVEITGMWSVINEKNSFNLRHNHANSHFSAAYYVKTNQKDGKIKFFDPNEIKTMYHPKIKTQNEFSSSIVKIQPEEGKLLLFPSYLHHSVEPNLSEDDRIVVSFNIKIK